MPLKDCKGLSIVVSSMDKIDEYRNGKRRNKLYVLVERENILANNNILSRLKSSHTQMHVLGNNQ